MATPEPVQFDPRSRGWVLAAAAACLLPLLLQLPPLIAIGVATSAVAVAVLSWRQPVAVWLRLLLALALAGAVLVSMDFGVGRDTACAVLAAMLAIKPAETINLRDARSLVGFALFAPFATFLLDQGPLSLVLGLVAVTLALAALQRLSELESGDSRRPVPGWRRFAAVWRMIAIGLPLALAVFWLFPRMASPLWGVPDRAQARPGLSDSMSPGGWQDLLNDDAPALRARFFGPSPDRSQLYWRGPVLWDFDGSTWTQPRWLRGLPAAEAVPAGPGWDYELEFEPTDRRQLVALDLPGSAPDGARLTLDHGLYTPRPLSALTRWRLHSAPPAAFEPRLHRTLRQIALELPPGYNPRTLALGRQWRREAGSDDAAIVQRALGWIGADFAYTLNVAPAGRHAVDEFLFDRQAGYCEHFSSAFVVLMRAAGVPARVVTGYAGGYRNRIGAYWLVRRSDAHAWAEAWLPERGWVRVDTTPAVAPERVFDTLADRASVGGRAFAGLAPMFDFGDWMRHGWNDFVLGFDAKRQRSMLQPIGLPDLDPVRLIQLFVLVASLALLVALWLVTREAPHADPVLRAWHRLGARYARLGHGRAPHEPAGDWAARVLRSRPQDRALAALSARFAEWRYAAGADGARTARTLVRELRAHRP